MGTSLSSLNSPSHTDGLGNTQRRDAWWLEPMLTALVLSLFGLYATLRAFSVDPFSWPLHLEPPEFYQWGPYLSPFCSPNLKEWLPGVFGWWTLSPAILILPFPLLFRATCYYYRKAYYRSFFLDPPACAVGEPTTSNYKGETAFPFVLQNFHRYAFYIAALFIAILAWDAVQSFFFTNEVTGRRELGAGLGSVILTLNVLFLGLYTFSCHSWRHLLGGNIDCFSCSKLNQKRHHAWSRQSKLNEYHMQFAWISLFTVWLSDSYIYLLAKGYLHDVRFF